MVKPYFFYCYFLIFIAARNNFPLISYEGLNLVIREQPSHLKFKRFLASFVKVYVNPSRVTSWPGNTRLTNTETFQRFTCEATTGAPGVQVMPRRFNQRHPLWWSRKSIASSPPHYLPSPHLTCPHLTCRHYKLSPSCRLPSFLRPFLLPFFHHRHEKEDVRKKTYKNHRVLWLRKVTRDLLTFTLPTTSFFSTLDAAQQKVV